MTSIKSIAAPVLRAVGFLGLLVGGFYAFALTFAGGFQEARWMWGAFVAGVFCVFLGDSLKESEPSAEIQPGNPATLTQRFKAAMIDVIPFVFVSLMYEHRKVSTTGSLIMIVLQAAFIILQIVLLTKSGQSIGKKLERIRIVSVNTGENAGFVANVLKRWFLNGLLCLIPLYALVDMLFVFRADRRCIHDFLAGTRVVQA